MYPQDELNRLAALKAARRREIAGHRARCVIAAARVAAPLAWLDRLLVVARQLAPLVLSAGAALSLLKLRAGGPRRGLVAWLLRWSPFIFGTGSRLRAELNRRAAARTWAPHRAA